MSEAAIALAAGQPEVADQLQALSRQLNLPVVPLGSRNSGMLLVLTPERLELHQPGMPKQGPLYVDLLAGQAAHRRRFGGGRGQPLARAIGLKQGRTPSVLDATAGLGRDAFVLASLGCELVMLERSPIVAALLLDGLERARKDREVAATVQRMQLQCGDAVDILEALRSEQRPDVIYMDPMYPHRQKSALVKKEMRMLRELVGDDGDSTALLSAARRQARYRVVVKRPAAADCVGGIAPSMMLRSPNTRYDVYVNDAFATTSQ